MCFSDPCFYECLAFKVSWDVGDSRQSLRGTAELGTAEPRSGLNQALGDSSLSSFSSQVLGGSSQAFDAPDILFKAPAGLYKTVMLLGLWGAPARLRPGQESLQSDSGENHLASGRFFHFSTGNSLLIEKFRKPLGALGSL